jgi:serine/threonine protein kinase
LNVEEAIPMSMLRKKIDSFYLVEQIGSGGMSEVYLGINPKTHEKRAFKILGKHATMGGSTYARFLREVDIIQGLSHPGIIKVLSSGALEDCYYYSMEHMAGGNLSRYIDHKRLRFDRTMEHFLRICDAMAYAHEKGVIHRDLKPSNILLDMGDKPVVSDFGIAKVLDYERTALTRSGEILGTIAYLAPEQRFSNKRVSRRTDVYALGTILYEMVMGFPPLGKFPWPRDVQADFPTALQTIMEKCLAVEPDNRFEHAGELLTELGKMDAIVEQQGTATSKGDSGKELFSADDERIPPAKTDRIELWFKTLRTGTTRERLAAVREMVEDIKPPEAKAVLKLYSEENDRVRWGLIRVLGELKIESATSLILSDLRSPFHTECAIEALGKIGSGEAYDAICQHIAEHPESALIALLPLAQTGKQKAVKLLSQYLKNELSVLRQAAIQALAAIKDEESLQVLKDHLRMERDEKVRTCLFQAVHALEAIMLSRSLTQNTITISRMPSNPPAR